jgi:N-acetylmuramoyl-L-alanine amidase
MLDSTSQVSAHYMIDEEGKIYQMVEEAHRAWHAGESYWQGRKDLNSSSIGIELVNPGHSYGYRPFPDAQITALIALCKGIMTRWSIPPNCVLGHSDVAPRRKQDPGHLFPWKKLSEEGLGLWPEENKTSKGGNEQEVLSRIGYETESLPHALLAFQRHFQPHKVDGIADQETYALLQGLLKAQEKLI